MKARALDARTRSGAELGQCPNKLGRPDCNFVGITPVRVSLEHPGRWKRKPLPVATVTERVPRRRRRGSERGTRSVTLAAQIDGAFPKEVPLAPTETDARTAIRRTRNGTDAFTRPG